METNNFNRIVNVSDYKISLAKLMEENNRRLEEYKLQIPNPKKKQDVRKQEATNFVCDWQVV